METSNQASPTNSDFAGKFRIKDNLSGNVSSRRLSLIDKSRKCSKINLNEKQKAKS